MNTLMNYRQIAQSATPSQIVQAMTWYNDAQSVAEEVSFILTDRGYNVDIETCAAIVSAFSPRQRWNVNVRHAIEFANGETPKTLGNNVRMAQSAMHEDIRALKGQKTNAFARAIAGDTDAVVIDVWMMRAAGMQTDSPNKSQYNMLADAVRNIASEHGLTPRTAQALIWIVKRGSHA